MLNYKKMTAFLLAGAMLSGLLLTGCTPAEPQDESKGSASGVQDGSASSQPSDTSVPDVSVPDASVPDVSVPDSSVPDVSTPDASAEPDLPPESHRLPLEEAAKTYTPEQAEAEGCLVQQDWIAQEAGVARIEAFRAGETDVLRVANFKTGETGCQVYDVIREKGGYTLRMPGAEDKTFQFLRKEDWIQSIPSGSGIPPVGSAKINTSYFLCDREDVTYLDCVMSQANAQFGTAIPSFTIFTQFHG